MKEQTSNKQNRPEQLRYLEYLKEDLKCDLRLEYTIPKLKTVDYIEPKKVIADIADLTCKMVYRLNGPIHEGRIQTLKDEDQKVILEGNGWHVMDIWYYKYVALFSGKGDWKWQTLILENENDEFYLDNFRHLTKKSD